MSRLRDFDFYRKIPKDLTETSTHGAVLSVCAILVMLVVFVAELWSFMSLQLATNIIIDPNVDTLLKINFNVTVLDMPCEFATIDVVDVLGTRNDNVTKNINKWQIDSEGVRRNYAGRNREQPELQIDTHHPSIEELHKDGVHATPIDEASFPEWIKSHQYSFVNFYAPWCIWCQRLEPVWEAFAEFAEREQMPVSVVKVDCVANRNLCTEQKIQAFPMLRLFKDGEAQSPDYRSDRTVDAFTEYIKAKMAADDMVARMAPEQREAHLIAEEKRKDDHPGCMMSGFLLVNRVPGNFHIEARSRHHNLNPAMANLSHVVNHLSFGPTLQRTQLKKINSIPDEFFNVKSTQVMNGREYLVDKLHQAYHHHIKVVSTNIELTGSGRRARQDSILAYQMVAASQVMHYSEDDIPTAMFTYDLSPMSVVITSKGKKWYEFITSICALVGGTFTVVGLISGFLGVIFKPKKM